MADTKISNLTELTSVANDDVIAVVDTSATETKKVQKSTLISGLATTASPTFTGTVTIPSPFVLGTTSVTTTATEINYVGGVSSAIQTQINAKAPSASPTFTGTVTIPTPFTLGTTSVTTNATEFNYVGGVTSAIQTQLNAKAPLASPTFTGTVTLPTGLTGVIRADSGVVSVDTDVTDLVVDATTSVKGKASFDSAHFVVTSGAVQINGELISDLVGAMVTGNTETGITVTYQDADNTLDFEVSGALALTTPTLATTLTLQENASIALDPAGSADGKYSGITMTGTGGATIAFGDLVTLDKDDSRWELVDISVAAAATGDARGILGMAVTSSSDGNAITVLLHGIIRADANFPALTIGAPVYASTTGDIVVAQPTTTDYVIRQVGFALTADEIYFNPTATWTTHV